MIWELEDSGALQVLAGMQPAGEEKMAIQTGPGPVKQRKSGVLIHFLIRITGSGGMSGWQARYHDGFQSRMREPRCGSIRKILKNLCPAGLACASGRVCRSGGLTARSLLCC
jgi:hypothetical protein